MANVQPILSVNQVCKNFPGVKALQNVDFYVNPGEIHALIGENGAGKSTLMKIILGSYTMTSGSMTFKGKPYAPSSPHDALLRGVSMIHQEISLVPTFTVSDNIWIGREDQFSRCRGVYNRRKQREATQAIAAGPEDRPGCRGIQAVRGGDADGGDRPGGIL